MTKRSMLAGLILLGVSCTPNIRIDQSMAASLANDKTGLIQACGNQVIAGFTYCRKKEGDVAADAVHFIAPALECDDERACVDVKLFFEDGRPPLGKAIPKGQTRVSVPWKEILGKQRFDKTDRGIYAYVYHARWKDPDGRERETIVDGELILRVYDKDYTPLHNSASDVNFAKEWVENGQMIKVTTKGRTYVEPK